MSGQEKEEAAVPPEVRVWQVIPPPESSRMPVPDNPVPIVNPPIVPPVAVRLEVVTVPVKVPADAYTVPVKDPEVAIMFPVSVTPVAVKYPEASTVKRPPTLSDDPEMLPPETTAPEIVTFPDEESKRNVDAPAPFQLEIPPEFITTRAPEVGDEPAYTVIPLVLIDVI